MTAFCFRSLLVLTLLGTSPARGDEPPDFNTHVLPLLTKYCSARHNPDDHEGGLVLDNYANVLTGGERGAAVAAGLADQSRLVRVLTGAAEPTMPPDDNERPKPDEIALLKSWIDAGAKGPSGAAPDPTLLITPKIVPTVQRRNSVHAVAFSPDGAMLAVARYGSVELRAAATLAVVRSLGDHRGSVNDVRFSTDGSRLIAAAGEAGLFGQAKLWNAADGALVQSFQGHKDSLYAAALSPDGGTLATAGYDQQIKLWNTSTGGETRTLAGHSGAIYSLAFHPSGRILASASGDRTIKLWDIASGERLDTFGQPLSEQFAVAFRPDGRAVAGGGVDNRIRVWQLSDSFREGTNPLVLSRFAHEQPIVKLAYSNDGRLLASSGEDNSIKLWEAETVVERLILERQSDAAPALAFSPDSRLLAVGRLDGTLVMYDVQTGQPTAAVARGADIPVCLTDTLISADKNVCPTLLTLAGLAAIPLLLHAEQPPPPAAPPKPELSAVWPRGLQAGQKSVLKLTGKALAGASVKISDARWTVMPIAGQSNDTEFSVEVGAPADDARGTAEVWLETLAGATGKFALHADNLPQPVEAEPNGGPAQANALILPAGAWGLLQSPGDEDFFSFAAEAGQTVVLELSARAIGSKATATLTLFDAGGRQIAANHRFDLENDPLLAFQVPAAGKYSVRVGDLLGGGGGEHFYRLSIGAFPYVAACFPLSVPAGTASDVELIGYNLPAGAKAKLEAGAAGEVAVPIDAAAFRNRRPLSVLISELPESVEREPNDSLDQATPCAAPFSAAGRIHGSGDVDYFRFESRAGQRWIVETNAARRGSPVDTRIDVLAADGRPIERLLMQAVRDSFINFRGVDSNNPGIRLKNWEEMELNEYAWFGGEICRLFAPQGPDSDFIMYEVAGGKRKAYFDTTATTHANYDPVYIVEPREPGARLPNNGLPVFPLYYSNDDEGERKLGSDSRLTFTAPADGAYLVKVVDVRSHGGPRHAYRLTVRAPKPDVNVTLHGGNPTVAAGGGKSFSVTVDRVDGFDDDVRVDIGGALPPGFAVSTPVVIQAGHTSASGTLFAAADAPAPVEANWSHTKVTATATIDSAAVTKEINSLGRINLAPRAKLLVQLLPDPPQVDSSSPGEVVLAPGATVTALLRVERNGFDGIVNLEVQNLPHGVIVDNIGLNNVQILEGQTERQIFLTAARWVPDSTRWIHVVAKAEGDQASAALLFHVRKPTGVAQAK